VRHARRHRDLDLFEILLILVLALIVLGPERLPEVLKITGKVLRELRLASNTVMRELTEVMDEEPGVRTPLKPPPQALPETEPPPKPPTPPSEST
jgi:sec-independent protein translocase protein TatB